MRNHAAFVVLLSSLFLLFSFSAGRTQMQGPSGPGFTPPPLPPPVPDGQTPASQEKPDVKIIRLLKTRDTKWLMYQTEIGVIAIGYQRFRYWMGDGDPRAGRPGYTRASLLSFLAKYFKGSSVLNTNRDLNEDLLSIFVAIMRVMVSEGDAHVFDKRAGAYVESVKERSANGYTFMFMDNTVFYRNIQGSCSAKGEYCGGIQGIRCCDGLQCEMPQVSYTDAFGDCVRKR